MKVYLKLRNGKEHFFDQVRTLTDHFQTVHVGEVQEKIEIRDGCERFGFQEHVFRFGEIYKMEVQL